MQTSTFERLPESLRSMPAPKGPQEGPERCLTQYATAVASGASCSGESSALLGAVLTWTFG